MAVDPLTDDSHWTVVGDCAGLLDYRLRGGRMIARDSAIGEAYIAITCSIGRPWGGELVRGVDPDPVYEPSPSWWQRQTREQQRLLMVCAALAAIWLISAVVYSFGLL